MCADLIHKVFWFNSPSQYERGLESRFKALVRFEFLCLRVFPLFNDDFSGFCEAGRMHFENVTQRYKSCLNSIETVFSTNKKQFHDSGL